MKPTITLKPLQHRNAEQIGIYFTNNSALNILIRSKADGTWARQKNAGIFLSPVWHLTD